jgi:hypothetical protein
MKKFTANFLIDDSGLFLKNGIVISDNNGTVLQFIDTKENLKEMARLTFLNGILITGFCYTKTGSSAIIPEDNPVALAVHQAIQEINQFSIRGFLDLCKSVQEQFSELKIQEIFSETSAALESNGTFERQQLPGLFLISGLDLPGLRFKPTTTIKQIL